MSVVPHIFREYDIRGVVGPELTPEIAHHIGRALGNELRQEEPARRLQVVIGCDNRPSSPELAEHTIAGLRAAGVDVQNIGTVPTPALYYAVHRLDADGGIQITGSHNPPEYNGFKMLAGKYSLYGDRIQRLRQRIETGEMSRGDGRLRHHDILPEYIADVAGRFRLEKPVKVVVDCGNGTGSLAAVEMLEGIGAEVVPLYCDSDGTFPNHHPDPVVDENLRDLIHRVREDGADFGVAFDGDADRLGVVDESGGIIRGDTLLLLFGMDLLARRGPGQRMVFDVKCSQVVPHVFSEAGGEPVMWKTGHSLIKEKMRQLEAPLAGELSGHIMFADEYYGFDDALYAACRFAELVARSEKSVSSMVSGFPDYVSTPEIRVDVPEDRKFEIVEQAVADFREAYDVIDVDGARVLFDGGWGLLRASNTQSVLVLRFEARDAERLARIKGIMYDWLNNKGIAT